MGERSDRTAEVRQYDRDLWGGTCLEGQPDASAVLRIGLIRLYEAGAGRCAPILQGCRNAHSNVTKQVASNKCSRPSLKYPPGGAVTRPAREGVSPTLSGRTMHLTKNRGVNSMPIYDYKCSDCGTTYDIFHKVREQEEDIVCPHCDSRNHVRLISASSFTMKGASGSSTAAESAPSCTDGSCCGGSCGLN